MQLREHVPLAPYTTLGLGGPAQYFCECASEAEVRDALALARRRDLRVQIIGGASNVIFADAGFAGLVVKVTVRGKPSQNVGAYGQEIAFIFVAATSIESYRLTLDDALLISRGSGAPFEQ